MQTSVFLQNDFHLTHKMDVFDFAGDLVWIPDIPAELTSDFSINRQYLLGL